MDIEELKKQINIINEIATKYKIVFGKDKSGILTIGKQKEKINLKMGEMELKNFNDYKYLGIYYNKKGNLENHIKKIKGKTESALQTILHIAKNINFCGIEMKCIWTLVDTCIIPIITYGMEAWTFNKQEKEELKKIFVQILKRILKVPHSTPTENIYIETAL